jgi:hypothetical protein
MLHSATHELGFQLKGSADVGEVDGLYTHFAIIDVPRAERHESAAGINDRATSRLGPGGDHRSAARRVADDRGRGVSAAAVFDGLSRHLPADAVDVGNHAPTATRAANGTPAAGSTSKTPNTAARGNACRQPG